MQHNPRWLKEWCHPCKETDGRASVCGGPRGARGVRSGCRDRAGRWAAGSSSPKGLNTDIADSLALIRPDLEQRLRDIGLSGHQARIYLKTLELGPLMAAQLADKTRVPRSKVYEVCKELIDKGLLEPESGVPRRFRAMPLTRLLEQRKSQLTREAEALEEKHRELAGLLAAVVPHAASAEGGLAALQGEARVTTHTRMMVRDARTDIRVLLADGALSILGLVMEEKPPTTPVRVVHVIRGEDLPKVRRFADRGVKFRHARSAIFTSSLMVDDKQTLLIIHPQAGEAPATALWSSEPSLVAAERARFAQVWKDASPLARRQKELALGRDLGTTELLKPEDDSTGGFAAFAAACIATLRDHSGPVDIALGEAFLRLAADPEMPALLAKHRTRLLLPFGGDPRSRAIAEAASTLGETRRVPPWLNDAAMILVGDTSLVASADPETRQPETVIATNEPGHLRWRRRLFEAAWNAAEEPRPPGNEPTALWNFSHRTAEAEAWLRHLVSIATKVVEVRGSAAAEAYIAGIVANPKVKVRRRPLPGAPDDALLVGVDGRLLLVLEGVKFSDRGPSRLLEAVDACVLTDSRAMLAFQRGAPEDGPQR